MIQDIPTEPHQRLAEVRQDAGYATASDAARAFGWNENTYRSHENGERGLRRSVAERYAKSFNSTASYILLGEPDVRFKSATPITGTVHAKGAVSFLEKGTREVSFAQLPFMFEENVYGFEVDDNADLISFQPGDLLLVWATNVSRNSSARGYCIVEMGDRHGLLRIVQPGSSDDCFNLEFPLLPTIVDARPVSISWVHAIVPRLQWRKLDPATVSDLRKKRHDL